MHYVKEWPQWQNYAAFPRKMSRKWWKGIKLTGQAEAHVSLGPLGRVLPAYHRLHVTWVILLSSVAVIKADKAPMGDSTVKESKWRHSP